MTPAPHLPLVCHVCGNAHAHLYAHGEGYAHSECLERFPRFYVDLPLVLGGPTRRRFHSRAGAGDYLRRIGRADLAARVQETPAEDAPGPTAAEDAPGPTAAEDAPGPTAAEDAPGPTAAEDSNGGRGFYILHARGQSVGWALFRAEAERTAQGLNVRGHGYHVSPCPTANGEDPCA